MLRFERDVRAARREILALELCRVRRFQRDGRHINSFRLVGECVLETAAVHGRVFLNIGRNWRTGFTLSLRPKVARLSRLEGIGRLGFEEFQRPRQAQICQRPENPRHPPRTDGGSE